MMIPLDPARSREIRSSMPACCRCNACGSGRCTNCRCCKAGRSCTDYLLKRKNQYQNLRTEQVECDQGEKQVSLLSYVQGCAENVDVVTSSTVALAEETGDSYITCLPPAEELIPPNFRWGDVDGSEFSVSTRKRVPETKSWMKKRRLEGRPGSLVHISDWPDHFPTWSKAVNSCGHYHQTESDTSRGWEVGRLGGWEWLKERDD